MSDSPIPGETVYGSNKEELPKKKIGVSGLEQLTVEKTGRSSSMTDS